MDQLSLVLEAMYSILVNQFKYKFRIRKTTDTITKEIKSVQSIINRTL